MPPDLVSSNAACASGEDGDGDDDADADADADGDGKDKGDGNGDGNGNGNGEARSSDEGFMVSSDAAAEVFLEVGVSVDSDGVQGSGLDYVTDTARANAAMLGRDDAICGAVAGPGTGGTFCNEDTVSGGGDVTDYVDTMPWMGDAIGNANPKAIRVCGR